MKKVLLAAAAVIALPAIAEAQDVQAPGVYIGVEGGLNWMFNTTVLGQNVAPLTGWALGGTSAMTSSARVSKSKACTARTSISTTSATAPSPGRSAR